MFENSEKISWACVERSFTENNDLTVNRNQWALSRLQKANSKFGSWVKLSLDVDQARENIILPYHTHGNGSREKTTLIPKHGMSFGEIAEMFRNKTEIDNLRRKIPECFRLIERFSRSQDLGILYFCAGVPDARETTYKDINYREGTLVHLDGLHRLLSLVYPEERSRVILDCYVAKRDD